MLFSPPKKVDVAHATNIPGKKVSQGSHSAFVPAPLPPELNWTPRLIEALSDAVRLIGRFAGESSRLPPQASSRIRAILLLEQMSYLNVPVEISRSTLVER
jgi:hypothetical protein